MKNDKWYILLIISLVAGSCLKTKDNTPFGPKAELLMTNLVLNVPSLDVFIDGNKINPGTFSFGNTTNVNGKPYQEVSPGAHEFIVNAGTQVLMHNTILLEANKKQSLFFYDSLLNNKLKTILFIDDTATIDTLAIARFLDFIPGKETLTAIFTNTTAGFITKDTISDTYIGNEPFPERNNEFNIPMKPGNYRIELWRANTLLYSQDSVNIAARKLLSFLAIGAMNGTGIYKESISIIRNN